MLTNHAAVPAERATIWADWSLTVGGVAAMALAPRVYVRPCVRLPYLLLLRTRVVACTPHTINLLRLMTGHHSSGGGAAAAASSAMLHRLVHSTAHLLRASLLLFVAVGWLQACIASSIGAPLPPALHLPLLAVTVAGLCWHAPRGEVLAWALLCPACLRMCRRRRC